MYTDLLKKSSDREKRAQIENEGIRRILVDIYSTVAELLKRQVDNYKETFPAEVQCRKREEKGKLNSFFSSWLTFFSNHILNRWSEMIFQYYDYHLTLQEMRLLNVFMICWSDYVKNGIDR